jgi:hypothetical protein
MPDNPMNARYPFQTSPRCSATSKRTGKPCRAPAVNGWRVCRFHGARGGAPTGDRHGNYRHGEYTKEAKAARSVIAELLRLSRETLADLPR